MASAAQQVRWLLTAARTGRLGYEGAKRWAVLATQGKDIAIVRELSPGSSRLTAPQITALASDLASIYAGAGVPLSRDDITDAEADALFPPGTAAEYAARQRTVQAAAAHLDALGDEDLYRALWGDQ